MNVEKGMEVRGPDGGLHWLKHAWSVLAFLLAGAAGLRAPHAGGRNEERETAPAGPLLVDLLSRPQAEGLANARADSTSGCGTRCGGFRRRSTGPSRRPSARSETRRSTKANSSTTRPVRRRPSSPPAAGPDRARRSGSEERAILESLSNHVAARAGLAPPPQPTLRRLGEQR